MAKLCDAPGCGESIKFIRTPKNRLLPVADEEPEAFYLFPGKAGHPQLVIVTEGGQVIRGLKASRHDKGVTRVEGWESHFSSCPGADPARRLAEEQET